MDATNCQNLFELRHKSVTRYFNFRILFNVLCLLSSFYCVSFSPAVQITVLLRVFVFTLSKRILMMMMMTVVVVVVVVMLVRVVKTAEQAKSDINSPRINKCSPLGPKRIPFVSLNTRRRRFCCQPKLVYFATFFFYSYPSSNLAGRTQSSLVRALHCSNSLGSPT